MSLTLSEPVTGVDIGDFLLTRDGTSVPLSGLIVTGSGTSYSLNLSTVTSAAGNYALTLAASGSGIADAAANSLSGNATDYWITDTTPPTASFAVVSPNPRESAIGSLGITFSESVTGVDIADFTLTRNGQSISLSGVSLTGGGANYTLDLSNVSGSEGAYVLTLVRTSSGISDAAGNLLSTNAVSQWVFAGLLHQSDLTYLGAFKLPSGTFGDSTFAYGGTALTYNAANNSLFMVGHDWDQAVAEVSIPALSTGSIAGLNTANVLQPFVKIEPRIPNFTLEGNVKIGGLLVDNNQLIGSLYEYYDAFGDAVDSHFTLSSLNLSTANVSGLYQVGNLGGGYVGGYMATVPPEWQAAVGSPYLTGQAAINVIGRTSAGPAVFGFDPTQLGPMPGPATPLVYYPLSERLAPETTQNPLFNTTTQIRGVVFPQGTDSVLFIGSHGTGPYWYGLPTDNGMDDTAPRPRARMRHLIRIRFGRTTFMTCSR